VSCADAGGAKQVKAKPAAMRVRCITVCIASSLIFVIASGAK
jgi:hypothetical protein